MEAMSIYDLIGDAEFIHRGAESDLYRVKYLDMKAILKWRRPKPYRDHRLDEAIRRKRMIREVQVMHRAKVADVRVPYIYYVSRREACFIMEEVEGELFREYLNRGGEWREMAVKLGEIVALMHNSGVIHGDLTTSNIILSRRNELYIIDFGLGMIKDDVEEKAVDIELLYRVLISSHTRIAEDFFKLFIDRYVEVCGDGEKVYNRYMAIRRMGRYVEREERTWK